MACRQKSSCHLEVCPFLKPHPKLRKNTRGRVRNSLQRTAESDNESVLPSSKKKQKCRSPSLLLETSRGLLPVRCGSQWWRPSRKRSRTLSQVLQWRHRVSWGLTPRRPHSAQSLAKFFYFLFWISRWTGTGARNGKPSYRRGRRAHWSHRQS
jgi:hypothetical protein